MAMIGGAAVLLTEHDWQWWFGVTVPEASRLVHVQRALLGAGIDPCPETVLGMSRTVLVDHRAPVRLRLLAELWDREPAAPVDADQSWPMEALTRTHHCHLLVDGSAAQRQAPCRCQRWRRS